MIDALFRPIIKLTRRQKTNSTRGGFRPIVEPLEDRVVPYALSGAQWADTNVTASVMPDGTLTDHGSSSDLFATLNAVAPTATWQREFARALQTWASVTPLNFTFVPDSGDRAGVSGSGQGDSRFGDIRLGGYVNEWWSGYTYFPSGGTLGGDMFVNTVISWEIGDNPDFYTILLHESGHALGLDHTDVYPAVMRPSISTVYAGLYPDDITGIQAMYGARQADVYDQGSGNNSIVSASLLNLSSGAVTLNADLTTLGDVDYFKVVASGSSLSVSVDARNLSLLAPKVMVYNANGNLIGQSSVGTFGYGTVATINLSGLTPGATYYVTADGATGDVFGMGAYVLDVQFSGGSIVSPPQAPSSLTATAASDNQINLNWQENANNEDGFRIERSVDGANFTVVGTAGANTTAFSVTGLSAETTHHFRVRAFNSGGDSAWSNIAQATTDALADTTLAPDAYETNDTFGTARDLGTISSVALTDLNLNTSSDVDFFAFTPRKSGTYDVGLTFSAANGNLDLTVFDADGNVVTIAASSGDNQLATLSLQGGRRYYAEILSPAGAMNSYDFSIAKADRVGGGGGGSKGGGKGSGKGGALLLPPGFQPQVNHEGRNYKLVAPANVFASLSTLD